MRIARIDLKAYGHFTDFALDLPQAPDFHLIYGPNEAGKSTISRALEAALFGVGARTADAFLHPYANLRVGLVVEADGERHAVMRRKGNQNTLVRYDAATGDESSELAPEGFLEGLMGGLNQELYGAMYGLNHDGLVAGGKALSEGQGEIGQALFAAGAGLSTIQDLRKSLDQRAQELFRPRASTTLLARAIKAYGDAKDVVKSFQTKPSVWEDQRKRLAAAGDAYLGKKAEQDAVQREVRRLERLAAVLPDVAARERIRAELDEMGEVMHLDPDSRQRRLDAEAEIGHGKRTVDDAQTELAKLRAERAAIAPDASTLSEGPAIDAAYHRLSVYRDARDQVASARSQVTSARLLAEKLAREIGLDQDRNWREMLPSRTERARVQDLAEGGLQVRAEFDQATKATAETQEELAQVLEQLAESGQGALPESLAALLREIDADGNPEAELAGMQAKLTAETTAVGRAVKDLIDVSVEDFLKIGVPLRSEIEAFRTERADCQKARAAIQLEIATLERDMAAVAGEIAGLEAGGEVPTAEQLTEKRGVRDGIWAILRRRLWPDGNDRGEALPNPGEYEFAVQAADGVADARFSDADRVSQHAGLLTRSMQMRHALELTQKRLAEIGAEIMKCDQAWRSLLHKHRLPDLDADALLEWASKRDVVIGRIESRDALTGQVVRLEGKCTALRQRLSAALVEAGSLACEASETLAQAIGRARELNRRAGEGLAERKVLERQRAQLARKIEALMARKTAADSSLGNWREEWSKTMAIIRLAPQAQRSESLERISQFSQLEEALHDLETATKSLDEAARIQADFEREVKRIATATNHEGGDRPTDVILESVQERVAEARNQQRQAQLLDGQIAIGEVAHKKAVAGVAAAQGQIAALCAAAQCETVEALVRAEKRFGTWSRLTTEVREIESRLVMSAAMPLTELLVQAAGQDLVQVNADLDASIQSHSELSQGVESAHAAYLAARDAFEKIDGAARAAEAEQDAADAAAKVSVHVAEFAATATASAILADVVEAYQQRHQGPMLARASEIFAAITGGRYTRVATDFEEEKSVLVVLDPAGKRKGVNALSSGRRDQLFLALRLAAIESHLASQTPVPVVVDDIVINFDDDAASATFGVLAELAKKTQVLFFTHHEHLLERAKGALGADGFRAHVLEPA